MWAEVRSETRGRKLRVRTCVGFTRTELLAVVALVAGGLTLWVRANPKLAAVVWEANCMKNLKEVGGALASYTEQNNGKLPFAFMQPKPGLPVTWDRLISTRLRVSMRGDCIDGPPPPVGVVLRCPDDIVDSGFADASAVGARRSYSMTAHRMNRPNWPPSPDNATGVGLGWSAYRKRGNSSYAAINTEAPLPAISLNMILEPSGTILVTEQINADNLVAKPRLSTIDSTMAHVDDTYLSVDSVHGGRCNYLMVDGHVVSLEPSATVGGEGEVSDSAETHFGMWTIAAGD